MSEYASAQSQDSSNMNEGARTALHVYPSTFTHESRMLRVTRSLASSGLLSSIHIVAIWKEGLPEQEQLDAVRNVWRVRLATSRLPGIVGKLVQFLEWYLRILLRFRNTPLTFVNAHSLSVLPLSVLLGLRRGTTVIYDTHELETETVTSVGLRKLVAKVVERSFIHRTSMVITVNESIARWYREKYDLKEVVAVRNIPDATAPMADVHDRLRKTFGISYKNDLLFLYQGIMGTGRAIPIVLESFSKVTPNRHVVFLGDGPLVEQIQDFAERFPNIHHHPAVAPDALLGYTVGADAGISLIENVSLSYYYSLPNKVFEYVTSGIPAIVSDFPEMAALIDSFGCGWKCSVNVDALIRLVNSLTHSDIACRAQCSKKANASLGWHIEEAILLSSYGRLLASKS